MNVCILAIGDEIVGGRTIDTNSAFVAEAVLSVGAEPLGGFSVMDDPPAIDRALERALEDASVVITTGGLGPTADDLTSESVARVAGRPLELHEPSLRHIEERFRERGLRMPENNRKQALLPAGSTPIPNPNGTAAGFICPVERAGQTHYVVSLPGVPREMKAMVDDTVVPWLERLQPGRRSLSRVYSTYGVSESRLDELLVGAIDPAAARLSFRAAAPRLQLRLALSGAASDDLESRLEGLDAALRERVGEYIYATGDEGMEETVGRLLARRGLTLAVAESCTGGLIGHRITDVPGSSAYFLLGVITYSNAAKERQLGVRASTLAEHGAVSAETAAEMAEGVRRAAGASLGLATTGIAGPGGGSAEKPVGTVCVGLAWEGGVWSKRYQLGSREREWVKAMTAQLALDRLRRWLLGESELS
jgi:nicotinamide-nucleotide amidase